MQHQQLRVAAIIIAILIVIFFGVSLVRKHAPAKPVESAPPVPSQPQVRASKASAVIPDDMAAFPHRHVAFNPMVEVMQDIDAQPNPFRPEYRGDQGTRARKRQAAADNSGGFQESEMFARMAHDAPFMAPLSSQTEFQQTSIGEQPIPMR